MSQLLETFGAAFVLVALALFGLGIGWLITKKTCLTGRCGKLPDPKKSSCDEESKKSCTLCGSSKDKDERK